MLLRANQHYGFFVATPGQMLDEATAVREEIWRLANDVSGSGTGTAEFQRQVEDFVAEYETFYDSLQGAGGYAKRLWGTTWEEIQNYKRRAADWQAKFSSQGGKVTGPTIRPPNANPFGDLGAMVKWLALGAAVVVIVPRILPKRR